MRAYAEALADARDERAFSNSTDGEAFMSNWCWRCLHDKPARNGHEEDGCPLILVALMGKTPVEWFDQWDGKSPFPLGDQYHCIEFRDENDGPPPPTEPEPTPPGQGELLPMEPYVGARMFADVVAEVQPVTTQ